MVHRAHRVMNWIILATLVASTHSLQPLFPLKERATATRDENLRFSPFEARQRETEARTEDTGRETEARLAAKLKEVEARIKTELELVKQENSQLRRELTSLQNRLSVPRVSFHGKLNTTCTGLGTLRPFAVITNEGRAFNGTSGVFTAPLNGTYFFAASAGTDRSNGWVYMYLRRGGVDVSRAYAAQYSTFTTMGSVQATLRLRAGQAVRLYAGSTFGYFFSWSTSFTGFLLRADDE